MSNAGGFKSLNRYYDMLAGNTVWNPWEPDGAYDALATVTVPSGGLASITFAAIPNTYKHLQLRVLARNGNTGTEYNGTIQFNSDTASNYSYHYLVGNGSTASAGAGATQTSALSFQAPGGGAAASIFGVAVIDILDYANISKFKTIRSLNGFDRNGAGSVFMWSGNWRNTSAVNSIVIGLDNGFVQHSQLSLYGVK
jgi:hypothetical protein